MATKEPTKEPAKEPAKEPLSSVSATELAQALIEALQQNTATRRETRVVDPGDLEVIAAISEYKAIAADLETLPLSK